MPTASRQTTEQTMYRTTEPSPWAEQRQETYQAPKPLEHHFEPFRRNIIGGGLKVDTLTGKTDMIYADWTASGRMYWPIEETLLHKVHPWVANTHTEASLCGATMTQAYKEAKQQIKRHVNANQDDVLIPCGTGMTGALAKLQRIMGLVVPEQHQEHPKPDAADRPVVLISHMEHHSNHTSWLETRCEVVLIPQTDEGEIDLNGLERQLKRYGDRPKIVSITACSNVTGVETPYHTIAGLAHAHGGHCFVDFAASAPYVDIDMHPSHHHALDAITFSPHKFLGGPGSPGILIFNKGLYHKKVTGHPRRGHGHLYRPLGEPQLQARHRRAGGRGHPGLSCRPSGRPWPSSSKRPWVPPICGVREQEINERVFGHTWGKSKGSGSWPPGTKYRLPIFSFTIHGLHYDLATRMLSDRFRHPGPGRLFLRRDLWALSDGHRPERLPSGSAKRAGWAAAWTGPGGSGSPSTPPRPTRRWLQVCHAIRAASPRKGTDGPRAIKRPGTAMSPKTQWTKGKIPIKDWFESPFPAGAEDQHHPKGKPDVKGGPNAYW